MGLPIDIVHTERLDPILFQDPLLFPIHISKTNIDQFLVADLLLWRQPPKHILARLFGDARQKSHGHAMDVPAAARLRRINVRMCVDPDDRHLPPQPLADRSGRASNGADSDGVVAPQGQHAPALSGMLVHLLADSAGHHAHRARAFHVSIIRIVGGDERRVVVYHIIVEEFEAQLLGELGEKSRGYQRTGTSIHA